MARLLRVGAPALAAVPARAQNTRLVDQNTLAWCTYNGDHQVADKWAVHAEAQQLLLRLGAIYTLQKDVKPGGGYTHFTTCPYGRHSTADLGEATPEHRTYEDVAFGAAYGRLGLEQRWLGQLDPSRPTAVASWQYQNRAHYQLAGEVPLQGPTLDDQELYFTFCDKLFISFGPNVGENACNQNRISGGLGYQFSQAFQLELNYLNQWLQHGEPDAASGQRLFENNNGLRLNVVCKLNFAKAGAN